MARICQKLVINNKNGLKQKKNEKRNQAMSFYVFFNHHSHHEIKFTIASVKSTILARIWPKIGHKQKKQTKAKKNQEKNWVMYFYVFFKQNSHHEIKFNSVSVKSTIFAWIWQKNWPKTAKHGRKQKKQGKKSDYVLLCIF